MENEVMSNDRTMHHATVPPPETKCFSAKDKEFHRLEQSVPTLGATWFCAWHDFTLHALLMKASCAI